MISLEVTDIQDLSPPCNENPKAHMYVSVTSTLIGLNFQEIVLINRFKNQMARNMSEIALASPQSRNVMPHSPVSTYFLERK